MIVPLVLTGLAVVAGGLFLLSQLRTAFPEVRKRPPSFCFSSEVAPASGPHGAIRRATDVKNGLMSTPNPEITTLYDNIVRAVRLFGDRPCMGSRELVNIVKEKTVVRGEEKTWEYFQLGPYQWITYKQMFERALNYGSGLLDIGLRPKSNFGVYHDTMAYWTIGACGCYSQSIVVLTVYANLGDEALVYAIEQGELTHIQTDVKLLSTLYKIRDKVPRLRTVITVGKHDAATLKAVDELQAAGFAVYSFEQIEDRGKRANNPPTAPTPDDLAVIMYTSGSTGMPKGVMISHRNMVAGMALAAPILGNNPNRRDSYPSYLPLAHVLALAVENACFAFGVAIGYASPRSLVDSAVRNCKGDLSELRPTLFAGVPTVYDRVRQTALARVNKAGAVTRWLFNTAYKAKAAAIKQGKDTPFWNWLVFRKFKSALGGHVRIVVSGGAPLSPSTQEFLQVCIGASVLQGYGLTETCGNGCFMYPEDFHSSRVGPPTVCCEIKLVDVPEMNYKHTDQPHSRGEVYIRGNSVTLGYYKDPERTAEAYQNGWFITGDIGQWNADGTLSIIDRKKNLIKPPHGEYVALEKLESTFKLSPYADFVLVYVDGDHNDCVAICAVNRPAVANLAQNLSLETGGSVEDACDNPKVKHAVLDSFRDIAKKQNLKSFEFIKSVHLCSYEWTPDNNLLTAAMKLNRQEIIKHFRPQIDAMYDAL